MRYARVALFLLFLCAIWFAGCSDTAIENATGLGNLSAVSVVRGLVYQGSPSFSVSHSTSVTSTTSTSSSGGTSQITGFLALPMTLMTQEGVPLERREFAEKTLSGGISFRFEGKFSQELLKLRLHMDEGALDIPLGRLDGIDTVVEIQDPLAEALAGKILQASEEYQNLALSSTALREKIADLSKRMKLQKDSRVILQRDMDRLVPGSSAGRLEFSTQSVYATRSASLPTSWETWVQSRSTLALEVLNETVLDSEDRDDATTDILEEEEDEEATPPITVPLIRRNEILSVRLEAGDTSSEVYRSGQLVQGFPEIRHSRFTLILRFRSTSPSSVEETLYSNAHLRVLVEGKETSLAVAALNPRFLSSREFALDLDMGELESGYGQTVILMQENLPAFEEGFFSYLFFRAQMTLN